MLRTALAAAALVAVASPLPHAGRRAADDTLVRSYARARALLDSSIAAHGGVDALRAARQLRVALDGHDLHRNQSRRAEPPYDRERHTVDLMIDLARGRLVFERTFTYPGGIHRTQRFVTDGPRGYSVDPRGGTHTAQQYPPAETQFGNLFHLPQLVLLAARDATPQLRWLGRQRLSSGEPVDVIVAGNVGTLGFDPATRRLRAIMNVRGDVVAGDVAVETEFVGWRALNGAMLPERRVTRVGGEVTQDLAYTAAQPGFSVPDSLAAPPAGSTAATPASPPEPARELAPGVWAVTASGYTSLVVAFTDHVLVVDAPGGGSAGTIQRVASLAPGKPIRWVVPTHHHDDHAGGVSHYAAAGATIVTTPGSRALVERMAAARPTLAPVVAAPTPRPRVETFTRSRVFTDGRRTVELHDIGPSPHAQEMLVAWIPEERILFQGDLIDVDWSGRVHRGVANETTTHFAEWVRAKGWDARHFLGSHGSLAGPEAWAELVRLPALPR